MLLTRGINDRVAEEEMGFCEGEYCESEAVEKVEIWDTENVVERGYCSPCYEAYMVGRQYMRHELEQRVKSLYQAVDATLHADWLTTRNFSPSALAAMRLVEQAYAQGELPL
jgi:hypothetical protein